MSDTPTTGMSKGALLFVVMLLALGALVLASNNISSQSMMRPGEVEFVSWTSPDGYFSIRHPKDWEAQTIETGAPAFTYQFQSPRRLTNAPAASMKLTIVRDNRSPEEQLAPELSTFSPEVQQSVTSHPITAGSYSGTATYMRFPGSGRSGEPGFEREIWLLSLSESYTLRLDMLTLDTELETAKPLFERMWNSMQFDRAALITVLDSLSTAPTGNAATLEPTAEPTVEATTP